MKKIIIKLFLTLAAWGMTLSASAYDFETFVVNDIGYKVTGTGTCELSWVPEWLDVKSIAIPESVTHDKHSFTVTGIGDTAFGWRGQIHSVSIPNTVTYIDRAAFYSCGITSIKIPNSVKRIADQAFEFCGELLSIDLGNSVETIGEWAFRDCDKLQSITIPNSVKSIGKYAFYRCDVLRSVTLSNSMTEIGYWVFYGCPKLTTVVIPESITSICEAAFCGCNSLGIVNIPGSITSIGNSAFQHCLGLTKVIIPESVTHIGDNAFYGCDNLADVNIPSSVTVISPGLFCYCPSITTLSLPSTITTVGGTSICCQNLKDLYCYAPTVPVTDDAAFIWYTPCYSATLHVPAVALEAYKTTFPWSGFGTIVPIETDGIAAPIAGAASSEIYNIHGQRLTAPHKGINIIDGKKVLLK